MFEAVETLASYWEQRAAKFARHEGGLRAVCSYGMPQFYNRSIEWCQQSALRPWLQNIHDQDVLEIGCGVGRWTERLAQNGNRVCGVDISPTMIAETGHRLQREGLCAELHTADAAGFESKRKFDAALSVTVVQHIMDDADFTRAIGNIAAHLRPGGRFVMLEAAPTDGSTRCNSPIFRARSLGEYQRTLENCGFRVSDVRGVDPVPLKTWVLPYLRSLPRPLASATINALTAISLPLDLMLAPRLSRQSWHKVIVAELDQ